jgi:hypothetical protein
MKKNPSIYTRIFKEKVELDQPACHDRFIWHVTYNRPFYNWLIAKNGLALPFRGAVFAHNNLPRFEFMYPYFVDRYDWDMGPNRDRGDDAQYDRYSFWRIDTKKCGFQWYIDPGMIDDSEFLGVSQHHYVCTPNAIPNSALRLYSFNMDNYIFRNPKIYFKDGSAHILPIRDDFDTLVPNEEINAYIMKNVA